MGQMGQVGQVWYGEQAGVTDFTSLLHIHQCRRHDHNVTRSQPICTHFDLISSIRMCFFFKNLLNYFIILLDNLNVVFKFNVLDYNIICDKSWPM